ncbi:MAG: hypothetical protein IMZ52_01215, partial [Actinobacteria bacterium]|nr:hypothetical protein [Actinomycetota bacterium]
IYRYHMNGTYFDNIGLVNDSIYETTFTSASNNLSNFIFNGTLHLAVSGEYSATASCPYVYVWNGTGYYFDSEAITRNVLPEWTGSQLSRLPSLEPIKVHKEMNWLEKIFNIFKLRPIDKDKYIYKLKITEELPENSYIDNVELIKVYHNSNEVYSGLGQNIWTIENKIKPSSVIDDTGKDVLNLIENNDEIYWNNGDYSGTNYEDLNGDNIADSNNPDDLYKYVELTFEKPSDADSVKLNFKALEFEQEASIWANMLRIMDEKGITSRLAIDGTIVNWFGRNAPAMFWIQIWDGNNWNTQTIVQEFPAHKGAEVAYKFDISNVQTDDLKIRFLGMPNEAGLDYVYADYSGDSELKTETIPFTKATFKGNDIMDIVGRIDNNFQRLQPDCGDEILLEFEDDKAEENVTYFLNVTGYYKALSKRNMDISDEEFWKILKKPLYTAKVLVYKFKNNLIHHTLYEDYIEVITSYAEPPPPVAQFNYILVQMVDNNGAIWNVYTNQSDNYMRLGVDEDLAFGSPTYYWDNISSDGGAYGYRYQFQESALSNGLTENCTVYFNFTAFNSTSFEYFNDTALDSVKLWSPDIILNTPVDSSAIDTQYVNLSVDANVTNGGDFTLKFIEGDYFSSTSLLNTTGGTNGTYSYNWSGFASGLHKWCVEVQTNDSEISGMREIDTRTAWTRFYEPWGQNNWTFTYTNYPLILSNETPSNASTGILTVTTLLSINISDPNGDAFDWTIECSTGDNDSGTGETNGTKNCSVSGFSAGTVYYWWVNATDGIWWTNETYHFTTASATTIPPIIPPGGGGGVTSTFGTLKVSLKGESVDIEIYRGTTLLYAKSNMAKDTSYTWSSLSAGTYKIRAEGVTSGTIKEQTVTITSGKTTEVIIDMKPSGTPGFEAVIFFLSIAICTFLLNRKRYKKWK